ncbi:Di-copper centre-containing protein [Sporormia fimetaria CBS 119925]|uniref:tyrosinase n=1 Tax=Sporormia fimetaria CBS 119925 TaxID=1340428 RepID=A0A6A6VQH4_9PLEO|nr:Di-copper centre-containing protein [Sporormia fimetaria CBS 119925]
MVAYSKPRGLLPALFALLVLAQGIVALHAAHGNANHRRAHLEATKREIQSRQVQTNWLGTTIAATGVNPSEPAERLEIRELRNNAEAWNLYLLGMEKFMNKDKDDRVGYYQIAGIHGRPSISWNGAPYLNNAGYCPHGEVLFGSWHRPYLAVFEQAWHLSVQEVIDEFPESERANLRDIARNMRIPYWDAARHPGNGQPAVPMLLRDQWVTVTKPSGQVSIPNPLHSYSFGTELPSAMRGGISESWGNHPTTLRSPWTADQPFRTNNNEFNAKMGRIRISIRDRIYGLFVANPLPSWGTVSTSAIGVRTLQNNNNVDSFESVHDSVHVTAGGHMYYLDYSAFDPLFWLHHANVDRLLAMYQVISPHTWVSSGRARRGTAGWVQGTNMDQTTELYPFTKDVDGTAITSADVRSTTAMGYYYRETMNDSPQEVMDAVNALYGPSAPVAKRTIHEGTNNTSQYEGRPFVEGDENYVLSIIANKYALPGSYAIHCFIGNPGDDTTPPYPVSNSTSPNSSNSTDCGDLTEHPDYVGTYGVLGGSHADPNGLTIAGALPLTTALQGKQAAGHLPSLAREDAEPYLKEHMYYRIVGPGGAEIPAEEIPGLHLGVRSCPVSPPTNSGDMPKFGEYAKMPSITEGKPAGEEFEYELSPLEEVQEEVPVNPLPEGESSCRPQKVIKYVDTEGNTLSIETVEE